MNPVPDSESTKVFDLLRLDYVVIDHVLSLLDTGDLRNLRLTCYTTKTWVETAKTLRRLPLHMVDGVTFEDLSQSTVPWTNIIMYIPSYTPVGVVPILVPNFPSLEEISVMSIPTIDAEDSHNTNTGCYAIFILDLDSSVEGIFYCIELQDLQF